MEFVASLVGSLAWPIAVVVLVIVFRPVLSQLASGGVRRWKAGPAGVEVEYWDHEKLEVTEAIRKQVPAGAKIPALPAGESTIDDLTEIAQSTPRAAVVEAFIRIESELTQILKGAGLLADARPMGARQLALMALDHDLITAESANAIEGLAVMRNLAVHGGDDGQLDQQRAIEYLHLAEAVLFALRSKA